MSQTIIAQNIDYGFHFFARCDTCFQNIEENHQWLSSCILSDPSKQNKSKCPYCGSDITFNFSNVDIPSDSSSHVLLDESGNKDLIFEVTITSTFTISFAVWGALNQVFTVDWGDGHKEDITLTYILTCYSHTYSKSGIYYISFLNVNNYINTLYLRNSLFSSSMPSYDKLPSITLLSLAFNQLTGSIPPILLLIYLKYLYLDNNQLTGSIPSLTNNTQLMYIDLRNNQLTSSIPSISSLSSLIYLYLHNNQLTGSIPSLTNNSALTRLYLNNNQLTGSIPSFLNNISLDIIALHNNQLTGSIPLLSNNISLSALYILNNNITSYTSSVLALSLVRFYASDNLLSSTAVNQILADFVVNLNQRPTTVIIYLHGTGNQAPTGQGLIDKATLVAYGFTVLTN